MPEEIIMPKFGWTMSEATITAWHKNVGDVVDEGDPLFSIETEKVNYDVEARASGVLRQILADAGQVVAVGEVVGYLDTEAAMLAAAPLKAGSLPQVLATRPEADAWVVPLAGTRRLIAERLRASLRDTAQVTLTTEVDAVRLVELHARLNETAEMSYNALLLAVVARALKSHPRLNSTLEGGAIHVHEEVHIGLAVDVPDGLLVPVLRHVERKDLATIGAESRALVERALAGHLSPDDLAGGTFTLTNLGMFGVDAFTPIVNPPQTAILGVGRLAHKPVVRSGRVEPGVTLSLSLSFDHQVVDGAPAARFLQEVAATIEAGEFV
jgi:pyruvate dehydrogenase E2 component (dihydrolipoamide acetyltransferase)